MRRTLYIWPCALMLILSGALGVLLWPPPTLLAYATLIKATGISGPEGGVIRVCVGGAALCAWALPWHRLRYVFYGVAVMTMILLTISFWDTRQGFACGSWLTGLIFGAMALYDEGRRR